MTENALRLTVQCYAGHRADEAPQRFFLGERKVEVIETLDRWLDPDHEYFKVRGDDQSVYILRHDVAADRWELTMFER
jgi:hypothetical protein